MKKKIFLIDDDHMICTLLKILIEDVPSLEFSSMCSSKEAVEYLKSSNAPPDLVLIDMRMPDMGGIETLTELKALPGLQKTRFSIFSTAVDKESVETARTLGAGYIVKDYDFVIDNIKEALSEKPVAGHEV